MVRGAIVNNKYTHRWKRDEPLTWEELLQVEPSVHVDAGTRFVDALQAGDDFVQVLVAVLLAFERLHEHRQHCQAVPVFAGLLWASKVCTVPVHKVDLSSC